MNLISFPTFSSPMPLPPLQPSMREKDRGKGGGVQLKKARQKKQAESLRMTWGCWNQAESEESPLGLHPGTGWMHSLLLILHLPGMGTRAGWG